ncbi:transglycosylase SLT domain-containing protein [Candidatus Nomurabacteria bacterium]|nr:transglycosylase SLT domain-containing protein [Candidatus Nomurabacteria bacterium]
MKPYGLKVFLLAAILVPHFAFAQSFTPPPVPQCTLTGNPTTILPGARAQLVWTSSNASRGTLTEVGNIPANSSVYVMPRVTTDYRATFEGPGGTKTCTVRITVIGSGATPVETPTNPGPTTVTPNVVDTGGFPTGGTVTNPTTGSTVGGGGNLNGLVPQECSVNSIQGCNFCTFVQLLQNIINWLLAMSVLVAAVMFAWAGILYFTANGNPGRINRAHEIFKSVALGFIFALVGYLVVQTIVNAVIDPSFFQNGIKWNSIEGKCNQIRKTDATVQQWLSSSLPGLSSGPTTPVVTPGTTVAPDGTPVDLSERVGPGGSCGVGFLYADDNGDPDTASCYNPDTDQFADPQPHSGTAGGQLEEVSALAANGNPQSLGLTTSRSDGALLATYSSVEQRYGSQIDSACSTYGSNIPNCTQVMTSLIANESSGNPNATSPAGALGLTQVLPSNLLSGCTYTDPQCNINSGVSYLNNVCGTFNGNLANCYAAYNGGASTQPGTSPSGRTPAMAASQDCPGLYAYQCTTNPGGLVETQRYVANNCRTLQLNNISC